MTCAGRGSTLSIVVPCYNEEAVIRDTHQRLKKVADAVPDMTLELVYVDDGSQDDTLNILKDLHADDDGVRVISLTRNFGHQAAISAGLEHASGDAVVQIDADLQDPPEIIPDMVARWKEGVDVVYGQREEREGESKFKLMCAKLHYRLINRLSDVPLPVDTGDFRLIDRRVVSALLTMPERDRYLRGMVAWTGFRSEAVRYVRAPRFAGVTKYPLKKLMRLSADGIISFSLVPLRLAIWMGFAVASLACIGIVYAIIVRLATDAWVQGWAILFTALLFLGGVQMIFLGVIGEYLGRIYMQSKQRPLYFIKERYGVEADPGRAE